MRTIVVRSSDLKGKEAPLSVLLTAALDPDNSHRPPVAAVAIIYHAYVNCFVNGRELSPLEIAKLIYHPKPKDSKATILLPHQVNKLHPAEPDLTIAAAVVLAAIAAIHYGDRRIRPEIDPVFLEPQLVTVVALLAVCLHLVFPLPDHPSEEELAAFIQLRDYVDKLSGRPPLQPDRPDHTTQFIAAVSRAKGRRAQERAAIAMLAKIIRQDPDYTHPPTDDWKEVLHVTPHRAARALGNDTLRGLNALLIAAERQAGKIHLLDVTTRREFQDCCEWRIRQHLENGRRLDFTSTSESLLPSCIAHILGVRSPSSFHRLAKRFGITNPTRVFTELARGLLDEFYPAD